ncbi:MAG: hypothetical protein K0B06_02790 [Brevefilum sp.]|nr:hypothetical protein [Brevefilum sp.]
MERTYWATWKSILARWGIISPVRTLLGFSDSLLPITAQLMYLGMPIFKGAALGSSYAAFVEMLGDEDQLRQFADYLQVGEV